MSSPSQEPFPSSYWGSRISSCLRPLQDWCPPWVPLLVETPPRSEDRDELMVRSQAVLHHLVYTGEVVLTFLPQFPPWYGDGSISLPCAGAQS